jgi:peptidoglycan hydrolase CwlO-like protein
MKKFFFILAISSLFFISCTEKKTKSEKDTTNTPKIENPDLEVNQIDSIANQLEKAKNDIDDAAKEVDKLLEEL